MDGVKFYKGHDNDHRRTIYKVYDEPQPLLGLRGPCKDKSAGYMVEKYHLESTTKKNYGTLYDCIDDGDYIAREISETEYNIYSQIQIILEELYLNQFSGGFPRIETIEQSYRSLGRYIKEYRKNIYPLLCNHHMVNPELEDLQYYHMDKAYEEDTKTGVD